MANTRGTFSSKLGLILASAGSAVGIGNLWRFPMVTGEYGGSAFLLIYIMFVIFFGVPVMISEFMIGRSSRVSVGRSYSVLAPGTQWKWIGRMQVLTPLLILCYYNVVAGWTLWYLFESVIGGFNSMDISAGAVVLEDFFSSFKSSWWQPVVCLMGFMLMTHYVITQGVSKGIERASKVMMPALFILLVVLVVCALGMSGASDGLTFLFKPDFSSLTTQGILSALGQAFFSLSLGMGILTTYASYFSEDADLGKTSLSIAGIDTMVAVLAGMFIFPAIYTANMDPSEGPSLLFIALPYVFQSTLGDIPILAWIISTAFFALLVLATLTSTISIHEVVTSYLSEAMHISRRRAATIVSGITGIVGVLCALSMGAMKDSLVVFGTDLFSLLDYITAKLLLPIGGLLISVFAGWKLSHHIWWKQMTNNGTKAYPFFAVSIFIVKWICPIGIMLVFLNELGLFKNL